MYREITGSDPRPQDLARWIRDIQAKKLTLQQLKQQIKAAMDQNTEIHEISGTADEIDSAPVAGGFFSALASTGSMPITGAVAGGSGILPVVAGVAVAAAAAGGGGGGSSSSNNASINVPESRLTLVGTAPLLVKPYWWLGDAVFVDLNRDGVDEIILLGFKSQPSTVANWSDSYLQILGFNTGKLAIETSRWLSNGSNRILGSSGGQITGDFNGDGWVDIWIAPTTDMRLYGSGVVLFNQGGQSLRRVEVDIGDMWIHDSAVADFNGDGYYDILPIGWGPDYRMLFGRADGTFDVLANGGPAAFGAGIAAADFLGDGSITFVITDTERVGNSDTALYSWSLDNGGFRLDRIATLPADRFYLPKWQGSQFDWDWELPHSIRALAHDFNRDGRTDVIVLTVNYDNNNGGHPWSEVQFLRNDGDARFTDVTDSVLVGYDPDTVLGISPRLVDINDDGILDIWLAAADNNGAENSNRVLIGDSNGKFYDSLRNPITEFRQDVGGDHSVVHYAEDATGRDWLVGIEMYSNVNNTQVDIMAAPLKSYHTADWIV